MSDLLESLLGIGLMVALLHGCGTVSDWALQCGDGKWRGFDHDRACQAQIARQARP